MATHSSRRPIPALVFLLALAVLAVVVWVRVADRDSSANEGPRGCGSAPQLPANSAVTVTVLNGVGVDGFATAIQDQFVKLGFGRGNVGNAPATLPSVATVTSGPNGTAGAFLLHLYITGSSTSVDTRGDNSVTVTLGQQFKSIANAAQVKAAMVKAEVSQSAAPAATPTGGAATSASKPASSPTPTCLTTPPYPTPTASASAAPSS